MDNTGLYLTYEELISDLNFNNSERVTEVATVLSAKVTNAGGDIYTFTGGTPLVGDVIDQVGNLARIIALPTGTTIQINLTGVTNLIVNGPANILHSDTVTFGKGESLILEAMEYIDNHTQQFFNKRTFDDTNPIKIEGRNNELIQFPVPIISIDKILINSSDTELIEGEDEDFVAFKGRNWPQDDRRNPRIKLNIGTNDHDIFTRSFHNRQFLHNTLTHIEGSFGFLEPDGSTPKQISKAVKLLINKDLQVSDNAATGVAGTGSLKRRKVDLHEEEFFELGTSANSRSSASGIGEVDNIIAKYRAPQLLGGSIAALSTPFRNTYNSFGSY